ncbi:hypothetical protein SLS62_008135 [Diatrype stigma]|uniref:Uncharacterized protein n=1 Tax=Diatrype stigma TaxID=117547 RepID=A0AAN9YM60_9PEZI
MKNQKPNNHPDPPSNTLYTQIRTNRPQLLGRDNNGNAVYLEPPGSRYAGVRGYRAIDSSADASSRSGAYGGTREVLYDAGMGPLPEEMARGARFLRLEDDGYSGSGSGGGTSQPRTR